VEADVAAALVSHGLTPAAAQIVAAASGETDPRLALAHALSARDVRYPDEHETALIAMLGPVGSGRTTALLRMALDCADAGREALLIAADTTHVAAREQVHAYAEAIGIPVVDAYDQQEFVREVTRARRGTCIFADVPAGEWRSPAFAGVTQLSYLALPSHWQRATVEQLLAPQATAGCAGAVLTFTDLATQLSPILSVLIESRLGVAFLSSGRDVATGIEVADPLTLASGVFATRTGGTTNGRFAASA
jgi:flagellar biosynthesis protein FlhF